MLAWQQALPEPATDGGGRDIKLGRGLLDSHGLAVGVWWQRSGDANALAGALDARLGEWQFGAGASALAVEDRGDLPVGVMGCQPTDQLDRVLVGARALTAAPEGACDVDGIKRTDMDRAYIARFRNDACTQRHGCSGRENALENHAAVDHHIRAFLARTRYRPGQLDFSDDARRELAPLQQLGLDRLGLGLADEQLQQKAAGYRFARKEPSRRVAVAGDELRARRLSTGTHPLVPGEAEALPAPRLKLGPRPTRKRAWPLLGRSLVRETGSAGSVAPGRRVDDRGALAAVVGL